MKKQQNVIIKGTKDGLTLHLDDDCSFDELKLEIEAKLSSNTRDHEDRPLVPVKLELGNRYLTEAQQEELKTVIRKKENLVVDKIESNVITKAEAEKIRTENEVVTVTRIVRSGQVLEVIGDLLLIGDVNPGGSVIAGGNIYILGTLRGFAHAGCYGNNEAVIVASSMMPTQLRIADCLNRAPDNLQNQGKHEMECAYIDQNLQIVVDRLQGLPHLRPNLTRLEGGH